MKHLATVGILGGGQLGTMMIQAGISQALHFKVLDPDLNCPSSIYTCDFKQGSLQNFDAVFEFGKQCDVVTIEFEHVNCDALEALEKKGIKVYPQASCIRTIQDKGLQKQFFEFHGFPTAPFFLTHSKQDLLSIKNFPKILKLRTSGYDGKGVMSLISADDCLNAFEGPCVVEEKIKIAHEVAILVARNASGDCKVYDPVDLYFESKRHILESLVSPSVCLNETQIQAIKKLAKEVIEKLNMVGLLAIECFIDTDGNILINEVAPRPHNSGHHTIEGCKTSQFEQVLRAILNLPLGNTDCLSRSVMLNVLGQEGYTGDSQVAWLDPVLKLPNTYPHWYGKTKSSPFRKLGHITVTHIQKGQEKTILNTLKGLCYE